MQMPFKSGFTRFGYFVGGIGFAVGKGFSHRNISGFFKRFQMTGKVPVGDVEYFLQMKKRSP